MPPASWTIAPTALMYGPPNYIASVGSGGFVYAFSDKVGSSVCVSGNAFCGAGTIGAQTATTWGGGFGVNLNQMPTSMTPGTYAAPMSSTGVTYALSSLPTGTVYLIIDNAATPYYERSPRLRDRFHGPPSRRRRGRPTPVPPSEARRKMATHLQFQVSAGTAASTFTNFS